MRLVLVAALVLSSVSFAQNTSGAQKRPVPQEIKFGEGDVIDGTLKSPDGHVVHGKAPVVFETMIRVRANFADKLMQSVSDLR